MSELKPRRARANAFDLSRTDVDDADGATMPASPLGDILPRISDRHTAPPPATPHGPGSATTASRLGARASGGSPVTTLHRQAGHEPASAAAQTEPSTAPSSAGTQLRGVGGRPAGAATAASRITATAARVPIALYDRAEDLVKGRGKPSWGQLIAWTCKTRQQEVIDEVLNQTRPPEGLVPRGQNKRGTASTQVTARFTWDERETFTRTRELAHAAAEATERPQDGNITATLVVIAALEIATKPT